ncbi:MAG: lipocalin-like domain-containing protein, partial [Candidatus Nanopelagicales bacterium]
AATTASLARLGLDPHEVAVWEDGYRAKDDEAHTFEWWYFDMQLDDGSTLVATFSNKPHTEPHGPLKPSVLVIYHDPDGSRIRQTDEYAAEDFAAAATHCDVRIGPNTVAGDLSTYTIHLATADLEADLTLDRRAPSWRPGAGISYFNSQQTTYMGWVVAVPYGQVSGTITYKGVQRQITGSAYHDHNWGNELMSAMLDHWYWGRAHIGDYTVVYVRMTTKGIFGFGAINLPTFLLVKGETILTDDMLPLLLETSGDMPGPGHQTYPTDMRWTWTSDEGSVELHVTNPSLIEALDMTEGEPAWKRPLMHLVEHPMYYDFNADAKLTIDLKGTKETVTGRTLYEKMMFR